MNPKISVIINNYNYELFLAESINSCINQTYADLEIIVVDDGSTDKSREMINSYGDKVIPIFKGNGGMSSALNAGFEASSGEFITFLDADDYYFPEAIENFVRRFEEDVVQVQSRLQVIDREGKPSGIAPPYSMKFDDSEALQVILERGRYSTSVTTGLAFRRSFLQKILPIPVQDYRMFSEAYIVVSSPFYGKICSIDQPIGVRRIHGSNDWGHADIRPEKFRKSIEHDFIRYKTIRTTASQFGLSPSEDFGYKDTLHLTNRLASLRLDPIHHPIQTDFPPLLAYYGILSCLTAPSLTSISRKIRFIIWFLCLGVSPKFAVSYFVSLLFVPRQRSRFLKHVFK